MGLFSFFTNAKFEAIPGASTNPKFSTFHDVLDERLQVIRAGSLTNSISPALANQQSGFGELFDVAGKTIDSLIYTPLPSGKPERLAIYRSMANFPEISDAIDEIAEAFYNEDENGEYCKLHFSKTAKLSEQQKTELNKAFNRYLSLLDLEENGYAYIRTFLSDGELCFENVIDADSLEDGLVALKLLPNEAYDFLRDVKSNENAGIAFYKNRNSAVQHPSVSKIMGNEFQKEYLTREQAVRSSSAAAQDEDGGNLIALPWPQVTYMNTGSYNPAGSITYPILEKARVAYNQLALMESSAIIYRVARSPERLSFSVNTGKLNAAQAEQAVFKMMNRFNTKKTASPNGGTAENRYDALSPVESFWFAKGEGDTGTTVQNVSSPNVKFSEMDDIKYFVKRLYMALKVPFRRWDDPTVNIEKNDTLPYEEYRFAKFVTRIQRAIAKGLLDSFIVHLKLSQLWTKYELERSDIRIRFTPPTAYDMYWKQKITKIKTENYLALAQSEEFARETLQIEYLGWTPADIVNNYNRKKVEAQRAYILSKIAEDGKVPTVDITTPGDSGPANSMGGDMGGGPGGPISGMPPPPSLDMTSDVPQPESETFEPPVAEPSEGAPLSA